jgi:folate-dependent phosphoribosylglycinamide formyltransferase PurN
MRHLVFTAKWIGLNCVEQLLKTYPNDEYEFVVCEPEADRILEFLKSRNQFARKIDETVLAEVRGRPAGHYDWLLNLWGSHIFKSDILTRAKRSLNIHPSYLPYCRGRDPVVWAVRHDWPAGLSFHEISEGVDEGPVWYQEKVASEFPRTGGEVYDEVAKRCWQAFGEQWPHIRATEKAPAQQVELPDQKTFRRRDLRGDQLIDLAAEPHAESVIRRLLAHDFGPEYRAEIQFGTKRYRASLKLEPIEPE